ncbi:MAG: hypothetical protein V4549_07710 [Bacteroidota bacterium]
METLEKTNRSFTDVETGHKFDLYKDETDSYHLIFPKSKNQYDPAEGTQVNGFYICAHTGVTIKINNTKIVKLEMGQFYNMKAGEKITHKKFIGFTKFTKEK